MRLKPTYQAAILISLLTSLVRACFGREQENEVYTVIWVEKSLENTLEFTAESTCKVYHAWRQAQEW